MAQFATSTGAATPIPQNALRASLFLQNLDGTDSIYIDTTGRVTTITSSNAGIRLGPGAAISVNKLVDGLAQIQDSWQCIASANTPTLAWFETETFNRKNGTYEPDIIKVLQDFFNWVKSKFGGE